MSEKIAGRTVAEWREDHRTGLAKTLVSGKLVSIFPAFLDHIESQAEEIRRLREVLVLARDIIGTVQGAITDEASGKASAWLVADERLGSLTVRLSALLEDE